MKRVFIYGSLVLFRLAEFINADDMARQIENAILNNPAIGDLVPGTGGVKKFDWQTKAGTKVSAAGSGCFFWICPTLRRRICFFS